MPQKYPASSRARAVRMVFGLDRSEFGGEFIAVRQPPLADWFQCSSVPRTALERGLRSANAGGCGYTNAPIPKSRIPEHHDRPTGPRATPPLSYIVYSALLLRHYHKNLQSNRPRLLFQLHADALYKQWKHTGFPCQNDELTGRCSCSFASFPITRAPEHPAPNRSAKSYRLATQQSFGKTDP